MIADDKVDFAEVAKDEAVIPPAERLNILAVLAEKQIKLEDWIEASENKIAEVKKQLKEISEFKIPELMSSLGISDFRLTSGFKVKVSPMFFLKIPEENKEKAFEWLEKHDHGEIVKHGVTVETRMTNEAQLEAIKKLAEQLNLDVVEKIGIHHMTGSAWAKRQIQSGADIPRELLGVSEGFKTKITR